MPTPTYTLIDSVTLASSSTSVTFSSIPQTYGDLVLVCNVGAALLRINGSSTAANYKKVGMIGSVSSAITATDGGQTFFGSNNTSLANGISKFQFMDYSATDKHKSLLFQYTQASNAVEAYAGRFVSTSAITSLELVIYTYPAGSTFFLYGIAKAL